MKLSGNGDYITESFDFGGDLDHCLDPGILIIVRYCHFQDKHRVRNLKFATYLKFATCENTNKINELW